MRAAALLIYIAYVALIPGCGSSPDPAVADAGDILPPSDVICGESSLLAVPDDPSQPGPWPVGARTVMVAGLTTEVWYPAQPGSEAGLEQARYDLRLQLPDAEQGKIPDEDNPWQECDCYRDLPLDDAHGPYPLVLFVHGTAAFRTQSAHVMTHWASRGFIVVASDHPKIMLKDALQFQFGADQVGDATKVLDALAAPSGDLDFLSGHIAADRLALAGHSAGGGAIAGFGDRPGVKVLIPMASNGVDPGASLQSTLVMGAVDDGIAGYSNQQSGYQDAPAAKRLVGLANAGHLAFSDLCYIGRDQGGILQIAIDHGVAVNQLIAGLARDGCEDGQLTAERGWEIIDYATAAVLEDALACSSTGAAKIAGIAAAFAEVSEYREQLR